MTELREFMFERVYLGAQVRAEHEKIANVLRTLFAHYVEHPAQLPAEGPRKDAAGESLARRVTDYLAGMTDRYCIAEYTRLRVPGAFAS
jgi:dGTPase